MKTNETARSRRMALVWSTVGGAAGLFLAGLIGWLWLVLADDSVWKGVLLAAVLALAALAGIAWQQSRAERRLRAALDAYAEKELAKRNGGTSTAEPRAVFNGAILHERQPWRHVQSGHTA